MVTYPNKMPVIRDDEIQLGQPTSEETFRKAIQITNFLSRLFPIGSIIAVDRSIPGLPAIDLSTYRLCDGAEIPLSTGSPLASTITETRNTPNLDGKHIRGALTTSANNTLGNSSQALEHGHSLDTGPFAGNPLTNVASSANARDNNHRHSIDPATPVATLDPFHKKTQFYIKIN